MRVFFLLCFVGCTLAVATPYAADPEVVGDVTLASERRPGIRPGATARPTEITVKLTPRPTPAVAPSAAPATPRILKPKHAVAPVPVEKTAPPPKPTVAPTPAPTKAPSAKPAATAAPKATPKPTAKPTSPPSGTTYSREQVIAGIRNGWSGDDDRAIAVADCESGLNTRATSPGGTYLGLWQFHIETWRAYGGTGDPRDHSPKTQTLVAWNVFQDHGWSAWPGCP